MSKERKLKRAQGRKGVREVGEGGREGGRGATPPKARTYVFWDGVRICVAVSDGLHYMDYLAKQLVA